MTAYQQSLCKVCEQHYHLDKSSSCDYPQGLGISSNSLLGYLQLIKLPKEYCVYLS